MSSSKITWYKIAETLQELPFNESGLLDMEVNGKRITVARVNDKVAACAYKCPHAGGILSGGFIDAAGNIVCPLHRYKFSLQNGRNVSGEGYYLKTFGAEIREDGVYIGFEEKGLFGWL
jgi:nitrite reductase/ring-hydroxylating ferredoxin subunit